MTTSMIKLAIFFASVTSFAATSYQEGDYLVKLSPSASLNTWSQLAADAKVDSLGDGWVRVKASSAKFSPRSLRALKANRDVLAVQPNYRVKLLNDYKITDANLLARITEAQRQGLIEEQQPAEDNPEIPPSPSPGRGADPLFSNQWGMLDIGVREIPAVKGKEMVVAVIDTGVDYTHEDLAGQLWRNPGEHGTDAKGMDKANNGKDDDGNGYVDDQVGWDFVTNDNKPYDLTVGMMDLITAGGNPGHGTHCAGNVGAGSRNGKGIMGAGGQNVKIMIIRFLSEKGSGTTADAIKSIHYAVANHAAILSNSWGSEGEDANDPDGNQALRDAVAYAEAKGKLFIAAAGNGHQGVGYDNDNDAMPGYPASYDHDIIVSVAALDANNNLGAFSNWGYTSVDIGAPGVNSFSTVPGSYNNKVIDLPFLGLVVTWDGTSMATPHVAGALGHYWSLHPEKNWREVKEALMNSAVKIPTMAGRLVTGGKLNLKTLLAQP